MKEFQNTDQKRRNYLKKKKQELHTKIRKLKVKKANKEFKENVCKSIRKKKRKENL